MDFTTTIYLADVIPPIAVLIGSFALLALLFSLFGAAKALDEDSGDAAAEAKAAHEIFKFCMTSSGVSLFVLILMMMVPSKEAMYRIAAAQGVTSVINQPDVRKLAGNSLELLNTELENYIAEAKAGK
jgi:hypothetical protein